MENSNQILEEIISDIEKLEQEKQEVSYNLFNLSSVNNHKENFHSDIIKSLLDIKGLHKEGDKFLKKFIDFLNKFDKFKIDYEKDYSDVKIEREKGRLDISIRGKNHCIIIENKVNNADDMDNQLQRYYDDCKKTVNVDAIVYLTLRGVKPLPSIDNNLKKITKNIPFFNDTEADLISGWLIPSKVVSEKEDTKCLINQYIKLIKFLGVESLEKSIFENLRLVMYKSVKFGENLDKKVAEYANRLWYYRAEEFMKKFSDNYEPFKKIEQYKTGRDDIMFENYMVGNNTYKMDVMFFANKILFRNISDRSKDGYSDELLKILEKKFEIELEDKGNLYVKYFDISKYKNLVELDDAIVSFVNEFLEKLRSL